MAGAPPRKYSELQLIESLKATGGRVYDAAEALGAAPRTIYDRIKRSDSLKQALEDIRGGKLDFAESKLMELIAKGVPSAVIFYLKCQGKNRGYVERLENTGKDGKDLQLPIVAPPRATSMEEWLEQNRKEAQAA